MAAPPLVRTLVNGLRIMEYLAASDDEWVSLTSIAEGLSMNKSTVLRLALTLAHEGFLEQHPQTRLLRLRLKLFQLGAAILERTSLLAEARPVLASLNSHCGEVVHLCVLDEGQAVYVDKVEGRYTINMYSRIGRRSPVHCTGVGKALLAFLPDEEIRRLLSRQPLTRYSPHTITDERAFWEEVRRIRERGVAFDNEEHEVGIRCVAAPVRNHRGDVIASISVAGPTIRMTPERAEELVPAVKAAARQISENLGYRFDSGPELEPSAPQPGAPARHGEGWT